MTNSYAKKAMQFIQNNYESIINKKDFISVSVGGSVARDYACNKSDIDLLCISKIEKKYNKIFMNICEFPVEIHVIPMQYIYALIDGVKKYSNINYNLSNSIDIFNIGAKKCNMIERKQDDVLKFFSDWREIKKITDSIILYEDDEKFLTNLVSKINNTQLYLSLYTDFENNLKEYSNIDKLINMFKIYSIYKNKIYSKVLWTDLYLINDYNPQIKNIIYENIIIDKEILNNFYDWEKKEYENLLKIHSSIKCEFCKNDYLQCNIMRCIHDYIKDAKKAKENQFKLGEILSIKKVIEYVKLLYNKLNISNNEIIEIDNKIIINDETLYNIEKIIKEECTKNACC